MPPRSKKSADTSASSTRTTCSAAANQRMVAETATQSDSPPEGEHSQWKEEPSVAMSTAIQEDMDEISTQENGQQPNIESTKDEREIVEALEELERRSYSFASSTYNSRVPRGQDLEQISKENDARSIRTTSTTPMGSIHSEQAHSKAVLGRVARQNARLELQRQIIQKQCMIGLIALLEKAEQGSEGPPSLLDWIAANMPEHPNESTSENFLPPCRANQEANFPNTHIIDESTDRPIGMEKFVSTRAPIRKDGTIDPDIAELLIQGRLLGESDEAFETRRIMQADYEETLGNVPEAARIRREVRGKESYQDEGPSQLRWTHFNPTDRSTPAEARKRWSERAVDSLSQLPEIPTNQEMYAEQGDALGLQRRKVNGDSERLFEGANNQIGNNNNERYLTNESEATNARTTHGGRVRGPRIRFAEFSTPRKVATTAADRGYNIPPHLECTDTPRGRFTSRSHTEPQLGEAGKANLRPTIGLHSRETNRPTGNQKEGASHVPRISQTGNRNRDAKGGNWIPSKEWKANVTCHACKGKGHYALDAECPMYGKPRPQGQRQLYAGAVMEDGEQRVCKEPSDDSAETGITTQSTGVENIEEFDDDAHMELSDSTSGCPESDSGSHYHEGWQWDSDEEPSDEPDDMVVYPHVMAMRVDIPEQTEVGALDATTTGLYEPGEAGLQEPKEVVLDESIDERDYFDFMPELTKDEVVRFACRIERLENEVGAQLEPQKYVKQMQRLLKR
ncbi:hypothetical protein K488DRAFT_73927, partial [Vararia minispora EC-137]